LDILSKNILFLCTGNSCRSQIADGLANKYLNKITIKSAGTKPEVVNPLAIQVMDEIGIDISKNKSKSYSNDDIKNADYVITLCGDAKDTCIIENTFRKKHLHWNISDPAKARGSSEELLDVFRSTRDIIKKEIISLEKNIQ